MKYRRFFTKLAVTLTAIGVGVLGAVVPVSPAAAAACSLTTEISSPYRSGSKIHTTYRIQVSGCAGKYWTAYSHLHGPSKNSRTKTYRGNLHIVYTLTAPCRTGTYRSYLQVIGEGFDGFRETARYISC
ncbi:hypothetical protein L0U85_03035 [Glycomyces sp. L485]|uniref:hypothetical protein n=1 Tax=Glycomyces sp. L485 TaxID=2909235 RepID=UPI001F4B394D|nr:hypothetical protein [Glycomyces sp. L485]MCH7229838.1 hypothetical protein [Glycomyces sp. L485]